MALRSAATAIARSQATLSSLFTHPHQLPPFTSCCHHLCHRLCRPIPEDGFLLLSKSATTCPHELPSPPTSTLLLKCSPSPVPHACQRRRTISTRASHSFGRLYHQDTHLEQGWSRSAAAAAAAQQQQQQQQSRGQGPGPTTEEGRLNTTSHAPARSGDIIGSGGYIGTAASSNQHPQGNAWPGPGGSTEVPDDALLLQIQSATHMMSLAALVQRSRQLPHFTEQHAAAALRRAAAIHPPGPASHATAPELSSLVFAAAPHFPKLLPEDLVLAALLIGTLAGSGGPDPSPLLSRLLRFVRSHVEHYSLPDVLTLLTAAAKVGHADQLLIQPLLLRLRQQVQALSPGQVSGVAWSLVHLGVQDDQLLSALAQRAQLLLPSFQPQHLASLAWSLGKLRHYDSALMEGLLREAGEKLHGLTAQDLSYIVWALGRLGHEDPGFVSRLLLLLRPRLGELRVSSMAMLVWALSRLRQPDSGPFLVELQHEALPLLPQFTPQELASTARALARLHSLEQDFFRDLMRCASDALLGFQPQELTNLALALGTVAWPTLMRLDRGVPLALLRRCGDAATDLFPRQLAAVLWTLGRLRHHLHYQPYVTSSLVAAAARQLPDFDAPDAVRVAHSLAELRHHDPRFLNHVLTHVLTHLPESNPRLLSNLLWTLATFNHQHAAAVNAAVRRAIAQLDKFGGQDLSNLLWSLAILEHDAAAAAPELVSAASRLLARAGFQRDYMLVRCHQYLLTLLLAGGDAAVSARLRALAGFAPLWAACQQAWVDHLSKGAKESDSERSVVRAIRQLPGCEGAGSERLEDEYGVWVVDVALHLPCGTKVAVEVDGPSHFMSNVKDVMNGSTAWRNRMLGARGWRVVSVPAVAWSRLEGCREQQGQLLMELLERAGVQLPAGPAPLPGDSWVAEHQESTRERV